MFKVFKSFTIKSTILALGMSVVCTGLAAKADEPQKAPFDWEPKYTSICRWNGAEYPCRVVTDGQEFYTNTPDLVTETGIFHFSQQGKSKPCGQASKDTECGVLLMSQENNERDVINFSYKKNAHGWTLNELNRPLGGANSHLKLTIPIRQGQEPICTYNGEKIGCLILPLPEVGGCELSTDCHKGYGFIMNSMRALRDLDKNDYYLYQASSPSKICNQDPSCQTGKLDIITTSHGYEKRTEATYWTTKKQWRIQSVLGNTLIIDFP